MTDPSFILFIFFMCLLLLVILFVYFYCYFDAKKVKYENSIILNNIRNRRLENVNNSNNDIARSSQVIDISDVPSLNIPMRNNLTNSL